MPFRMTCEALLRENKDFLTNRPKKTNDNYYGLQEQLLVSCLHTAQELAAVNLLKHFQVWKVCWCTGV